MKAIVLFLREHGYAVMFASVLAEQVGIPVPSTPVLLAMGALAGLGHFSLAITFLLALLACYMGDSLWYVLGRTRGMKVLRLLCKVSLEPDSCVSNTRHSFESRGSRTLLIAKFVPGISTMAPPMAGLTKMPFGRFTLADTAGGALWLMVYLGIGYIFREQLEDVGLWAERFGSTLVFLVIALLASWLGFKYYQRWSFLRSLRVNRITPDEVMEKIRNNEPFLILDMRSGVDDDDSKIAGATYLTYEDLEQDKHDIPLDRDIILYCT